MPGASTEHKQWGEMSGLPDEEVHTAFALTLINRLRGATCQ